ncbi:MAG: hypothetical protein AAF226_13015, partial [Verrucomicrobiota bacterium]
ALFIVPVMFLDRLAGDEFRNSIQGVFTLSIGATSRILAGLTGGWIALNFGIRETLAVGGGLAIVACLIIVLFFQRIPNRA